MKLSSENKDPSLTTIDQLKAVLKDYYKVTNLVIIDGVKQKDPTALNRWYGVEPHSMSGMVNAYGKMLEDIDKPLSGEIIKNIRKGFADKDSLVGTEYGRKGLGSATEFRPNGAPVYFSIPDSENKELNQARLDILNAHQLELKQRLGVEPYTVEGVNDGANIARVNGIVADNQLIDSVVNKLINSYNTAQENNKSQ